VALEQYMNTFCRRDVLAAGLGVTAILAFDIATQPGAFAQANVGAPAPAFTAADTNGRTVSLANLKGKTVVLEWTNHQCPYVGKHYRGNNMQALQKKWTAQNVVWLSVISSAPGTEGYVSPEQANKLTVERGAAPTAILLDPKGTVGHAYGARTTPHMYVIAGDGKLVYAGGIDDKQSASLEDLKTAKNFVDAALAEVSAGKPVSISTARPYGCSVKYGS
jgi:peroxiredoxin